MERKKIIAWDDPELNSRKTTAISGLDYLLNIKEGKICPPPIAKLVGYKISKVKNGLAVFELQPKEYHYNPFSTVHGGIISTLLDTTMAASVLSTLDKGMGCSTAEIKINFLRPITMNTGLIQCEAKPIHIGKKLATAEGKITDSDNHLYSHGTCTCFLI